MSCPTRPRSAVRAITLGLLLLILLLPPAAGARGARVRSFSGSGTRILAPMSFPRGAVARFRARGGIFMLIALSTSNRSIVNPQLLVSTATHGTGYVPPGRYVLKVAASGAWSLRLAG